jgi:hypothetical protein
MRVLGLWFCFGQVFDGAFGWWDVFVFSWFRNRRLPEVFCNLPLYNNINDVFVYHLPWGRALLIGEVFPF